MEFRRNSTSKEVIIKFSAEQMQLLKNNSDYYFHFKWKDAAIPSYGMLKYYGNFNVVLGIIPNSHDSSHSVLQSSGSFSSLQDINLNLKQSGYREGGDAWINEVEILGKSIFSEKIYLCQIGKNNSCEPINGGSEFVFGCPLECDLRSGD